jgi:hypothetical protein
LDIRQIGKKLKGQKREATSHNITLLKCTLLQQQQQQQHQHQQQQKKLESIHCFLTSTHTHSKLFNTPSEQNKPRYFLSSLSFIISGVLPSFFQSPKTKHKRSNNVQKSSNLRCCVYGRFFGRSRQVATRNLQT